MEKYVSPQLPMLITWTGYVISVEKLCLNGSVKKNDVSFIYLQMKATSGIYQDVVKTQLVVDKHEITLANLWPQLFLKSMKTPPFMPFGLDTMKYL